MRKVYALYRKGLLSTDEHLKSEFLTDDLIEIKDGIVTIREQGTTWYIPMDALVSLAVLR